VTFHNLSSSQRWRHRATFPVRFGQCGERGKRGGVLDSGAAPLFSTTCPVPGAFLLRATKPGRNDDQTPPARRFLTLWPSCRCLVHSFEKAREYVIKRNLLRRQLTGSQRAMAAQALATVTHGGDRKIKFPDRELDLDAQDKTVKHVAEIAGVSKTQIARAKRVTREAPPRVAVARAWAAIAHYLDNWCIL
jgi:hypothetical protein